MKAYLLRRLIQFIPVLIGVSLLIFILMRIVPGDVALNILLGPDGEGDVDPIVLAQLRDELGLTRPIYEQYFDWMRGVVTLDWGDSLFIEEGTPVLEMIGSRFPLTFEMATLTMLIALSIALPLGIISAIRQNTWIDYSARILSIGGLAMPSFWVAALILVVMVVVFTWSPPFNYVEIWENPWRNIQQLIWGALALGYLLAAVVARMVRSTLLEVLRQDYIRTATSKGLQERDIVIRHALKNAILPVVTIVGLQYASLIGGTVIMEQIWNLPGLGAMLIESITFRDFPVIQGLVLIFAIIILLANLLVDILYAWLDPRVRYT